ncbi:arsenate reductase/protein-tyrosine-phosphatase family protein [Aeromicrobium duanguangcaii]|uniref:Phosphotyrosine protein phosphatase I domain-containing protein n=1 Tax=Aeromicrobium duanguangcaii TaxID=2968086 RepID=A0ABY5KH52_9ACTN|nr:hypothetical protein [Aeromicrobium duanguangcaii]MCD9153793.1 hypothetical protein [Aeromicrobium duanguangcaii]UUI69129.1 hypothetical protein NP095_03205 [Aeromicrobium duanguangcaii]
MELISGDSASSDVFTLVAVCTANVCRSPVMATVLSHAMEPYAGLAGSGVYVTSAGVTAATGAPIDARTAEALSQAGFALPETVATQLERDQVASADLILTASRRHRATIVRMMPQARDRTFTIREFARYCELLSSDSIEGVAAPDRLRSVLSQVQEMRGFDLPSRPHDDDVADPIAGSRRVHRKAVRTIVAAAESILAVVDARAHDLTAGTSSSRTGWDTLLELARAVR